MAIKFKPVASPVPSPAELVRAVREAEPSTPPARVDTSSRNVEAARNDVLTTLNLRLRESTLDAIAKAAESGGLTMKQVVTMALRNAGVTVADADLEDRTRRRRRV